MARKRELSILREDPLTQPPFPCANCDKPVKKPSLFCTDLCTEEARYVRYYRACNSDGRSQRADVQEALQIRLAMILGGGYPGRERALSQTVRQTIIARDGGKCRMCGQPANQIDHIRGNDNDLANLQLLCVTCHNAKTVGGFVPITPETHPEAWAKTESLYARVLAPVPLRACDAPEWNSRWRLLLSQRQQTMKQMIAAAEHQ
jgi:5-methylcytosine-specific restriction endonuclease McrA